MEQEQEATLMKGMAVLQKNRIHSAEELYKLWYGESTTVVASNTGKDNWYFT